MPSEVNTISKFPRSITNLLTRFAEIRELEPYRSVQILWDSFELEKAAKSVFTLLTIIGIDTAENEPFKVLASTTNVFFLYYGSFLTAQIWYTPKL